MSITRNYPGNERAMVEPRMTRVRNPDVALKRAAEVYRRHLSGQPAEELMAMFKVKRRQLQRILKSLPEETKEHIRRARNRGYVA